ncbi:MAG: hypothetical protein FJW34_06250 [Acidobacteria bacterium]|nr:hypothetical protein [Acidobacteriota bacterium]
MSSLSSRARYLSRMISGQIRLLRSPPHPDPDGLIRRQMANREQHFLELVRRTVFADPANPYHQMLRLAGCGYQDLAEAVQRNGVEATLGSLHRQGVYLAHDEFKGRKAIVRSNREIPWHEASFRNPLVKGGMEGFTGGSSGAPTRTRRSVPARLHGEAYHALAMREFGLAARRYVQLKPILPASDGLLNVISFARLGCCVERWFTPVVRSLDSAHYGLATHGLVALARLWGLRIPFPVDLPANDFSPVAFWIAQRQREGIACILNSYASPAVRVAAAAAEKGLDISGALFLVGGETLTDAKRRTIESVGAAVFPRYAVSEIGSIGHACRQLTSGDCVHLFSDAVAVISHRRPAPLSDTLVDSLLFTTLLPYAPHVLINAEMDDSGVLATASCDCTFARAGFTQVVREISSFGKLTGHGVTLVGSDVVRILEDVLPRRFGGCPADYQLAEHDGHHQARVTLRVSRRLAVSSLAEVRDCFLRELRSMHGGQIASRLWRDADVVAVVQQDPVATARGKMLPLRLLGSGRPHES